jgi:FixJ family two-component response regulator
MVNEEECKIFIIDDDESVRRGISLLLKSAGYRSESFASVSEFLDMVKFNSPSCILLDVFMAEESGLEMLEAVKKKFIFSPVIFISGYGNIPMSVNALKKGAINFLQKPIEDEVLIEAIEEALRKSKDLIDIHKQTVSFRMLVDSLTRREFEIFRMVSKGKMNKEIASDLNIAEHTVKLHRGKVTEKLGVKSIAEIVKIAEQLHLFS